MKKEFQIKKILDGETLIGKRRQNTAFVFVTDKDGMLQFSHVKCDKTETQLTYIDSGLPQIISNILPWIDKHKSVSFLDTCNYLTKENPMQLEDGFCTLFYRNILSKLASGFISYRIDNKGALKKSCDFVLIQHGQYFLQVWPIQTQDPSVLLPYLSFERSNKNCRYNENGIEYRELNLIVKYVDKTAPTNLGDDLSKSLCTVDLRNHDLLDSLTAMSCRHYEKYKEQASFFGKETIDMINKQVY